MSSKPRNSIDSIIDIVSLVFLDLIQLSLRQWCAEYIARIDASFGKEVRS
jgi:hypothetical protein